MNTTSTAPSRDHSPSVTNPSDRSTRSTQDRNEKIKIKLRMQDNSLELIYQIKMHTRFKKLFDNYCTKNELDPESIRFMFDGTRVTPNDSPLKFEMIDGDVIEVPNNYQLSSESTNITRLSLFESFLEMSSSSSPSSSSPPSSTPSTQFSEISSSKNQPPVSSTTTTTILSSKITSDIRDINKKLPTNDKNTFVIPSSRYGINAVQINSAREMFLMSTRSRQNPNKIMPNKYKISNPPYNNNNKNNNNNNNNNNDTDTNTNLFSSYPSSPPPPPLALPLSLPSSNYNHTHNFNHELDIKIPINTSNVMIPATSHDGPCNNPKCSHCGAVIIPAPASSFPIKDSPSISINNWEVFTTRKPIFNAQEIDYYEKKLNLPLPEMIFGNNHIKIINSAKNFEINFNTIDALDLVLKYGCDEKKLLKVAHSDHWRSVRKNNNINNNNNNNNNLNTFNSSNISNSSDDGLTKILKPFDWTYTTHYKGTLIKNNCIDDDNNKPIEFKPTNEKIPLNKLKREDPILFFDEMILYEDELADNGISILQIKIRVMAERLLLLSRFFLRVDNVIFKIKDTRLFIEFNDNFVLREYKELEDTYDNVLHKAKQYSSFYSSNDPRALLRDSNWVSGRLKHIKTETEEIRL
ncbi:Tip41p [Ascoidea rubescens DSM 1968]|uniref:TIP41-domain-containing protein n=1 Tax=Ascoidea rubescens DSM 1968 TaxID=1344418 RepID=A0A1D2VEL7_9ASCO|nr:TIP41-domain-containing protein [Ascoidea rubescens DSM 1968]ODV60091.1 TIP41-domain-containing protein [Ascoidea rubescens DSM 1968]